MEEPQQHPRPRHPARGWRALIRAALAAALALTALFGAAAPSQAIMGGRPTAEKAYPWAVKLTLTFGKDTYYCTGSLITSYAVLTAAHCLTADATWTGPTAVTATFRSGYADQYSVAGSRSYTEPGYNQFLERNDLGVLYLQHAVKEPTVQMATSDSAVNSTVYEAGFGCTSNPDKKGSCKTSSRLMEISTTILFPTLCPRFKPPIFCTYSTHKTIEPGDSGGPVVRLDNGKIVLIGVNMARFGTTYFDWYTSVPSNLSWIKHVADI